MIYLGKIQNLKVAKATDNGVYLCSDSTLASDSDLSADESCLSIDRVLLPKNQVPEDTKLNDIVQVFIYKDSEDRPIATTKTPALTLGTIARMKVLDVTKIGAFLDWGLAKDLFLPFKEQTYRPSIGDEVLAALYIDKSTRLCATMKVYNYLKTDSPYQREEHVTGIVYDIIQNFGAYVAVDYKFSAMIPKKELFSELHAGMEITARVTIVHEDGKLELSIREKAYMQLNSDSASILAALQSSEDGFLPYHDKTDPEILKEVFHLSKNAFKRAIGHLMKDGQIMITDSGIQLKK